MQAIVHGQHVRQAVAQQLVNCPLLNARSPAHRDNTPVSMGSFCWLTAQADQACTYSVELSGPDLLKHSIQ